MAGDCCKCMFPVTDMNEGDEIIKGENPNLYRVKLRFCRPLFDLYIHV